MTLLNYSNMSDSVILFSSDDEDSEANYESKQYNNFSAMLKGIPPPSSITISKFTVDEMLERYRNYENSSGLFFDPEKLNHANCKKKSAPFLKYSNSSHLSESIASLIQKVQERYVQMETMSSCNLWFNATLQTCGSAKKRQRMKQRIGLSPGRRLSHLARRRQFFSSANLQRLANNDVRQIEIKKSDSQRCERRKTARTVEYEKLNSSKRALFLSPENGTPTKYGNTVAAEGKILSSGSEDGRKLPLREKSKKVEVLKWLSEQNFDVDLPRKRLRGDTDSHSVERLRKCPRRSLNFADEEVPKSSNSVATSDSSSSTRKKMPASLGKLSQNHKNKLLWAVSVVLKENNISREDANFKTCASTLFHKCRKNLDEILNMKSTGGTSEKILHYARNEIPGIFNELGIRPLIPDGEKTAKSSEESCSSDTKNEMKENMVGNGAKNPESSKSKGVSGGDLDFVFKTPNKVCRRRPVKSCQKTESPVGKRACLRKWHSLESLRDDDKPGSKTVEKLLDGVTVLGNSNSVRYLSKINAGSYSLKEHSLGRQTPVKECRSVDESSLMFSPIPSSLKDECESPKVLFPALNVSPSKSEINSNANSPGSEANDSAEIANQDKEIKLGIESLFLEENFKPRGSDQIYGSSVDVLVVGQRDQKSTSDIERSAQIVESGATGECAENSNSNAGLDEFCGTSNTEDAVVEKAVYKPRKLVVKKSKPNWKVVRKNSEESESECELRLKMRLSHEWEIVCRNSSSSELGNASECEAGSLNCSQVSSTNHDKVPSSEMDPDESNRQSSVHSVDESLDQEWEKPGTSSRHDGRFGFAAGNPESPYANEYKNAASVNSSVCQNDAETLLHPDVQTQLFHCHRDEYGSSDYEESCNNFFRPSYLNRTLNWGMTTENVPNSEEVRSFTGRDAVNRDFYSTPQCGSVYGNVLSVSYGENVVREGGNFTESYPTQVCDRGDSSVLFVRDHKSNGCDGSGGALNTISGNPEGDNLNGGDWNRGLRHGILEMDSPLLNLPNGRRDCCL